MTRAGERMGAEMVVACLRGCFLIVEEGRGEEGLVVEDVASRCRGEVQLLLLCTSL